MKTASHSIASISERITRELSNKSPDQRALFRLAENLTGMSLAKSWVLVGTEEDLVAYRQNLATAAEVLRTIALLEADAKFDQISDFYDLLYKAQTVSIYIEVHTFPSSQWVIDVGAYGEERF